MTEKTSGPIKNIIIVYDYGFVNGGAAKVAINTAIELSKNQNFNIFYFCGTGPLCDDLKNSNLKCICVGEPDINNRGKLKAFFSGVFDHKVYKSFYSFLQCFSPLDTIIHIHGWSHSLSSSILKASKKLHFKRVITLHDYFIACPNGGFLNYKTNQICRLKPLSAACIRCNCDKRSYIQKLWRVLRQKKQKKYLSQKENFIYLSELSKSVIVESYPNAHYFYYPNKISKFDYKSYGSKGKTAFLYMGRLSKEKGIELFCEAVTKGSFKGIVVGDGELRDSLEKKFPKIDFTGWLNRDSIEKILPNIIALVFPSLWYEVSPLTVPEMIASNIPCIVSDCTSSSNMIKDSINGFHFKSGNCEDLQAKMNKALRNDFSFNSRDTKCQSNLKNIYEEILYE
jgi:glycosyltransferase involved in cell wall biosynthesis